MRGRKKWTASEDDFLRANFCLTNEELGVRLSCDASTIRRRFADLAIFRPSGKNELARARYTILRERLRGSVPEEWHSLPSTRSDAKSSKSTFFWNGAPCAKHGHISRRKTSSGGCWECECLSLKERISSDPSFREKRYSRFRESYRRNRSTYLENQKIRKNSDKSREWYREYESKKRKTDVLWRISKSLRDRLYKAVTRGSKVASAITLVGCTIEELKGYIENQFKDGMSWENYGEWHIDHIRPCISFDLDMVEQQKLCFHYSNLRPIWSEENRAKGGIWQGVDPRRKPRTPKSGQLVTLPATSSTKRSS